MLNKIVDFFKSDKETSEQIFLKENHIEYNVEQGFIINSIIVNEWSERLEYLSNRRVKRFDDLKALYDAGMIINEKIDLEISTQRFVTRLGNTKENLLELKHVVKLLNEYYRNFLRDKK
ncbi:hypothetical protein [Acinetobacter faecalis]|uniref:hypothetical protein n=1 Tax=Acinetobacter faecalis TaxID=2665161 RepID=UPI002A90F10C|nr:hypothetical protein [Acinetobacter faecalis]MDY6457299.1 hypothetical protein [Acinetobacter faecalis]